MTKNTKKSWKKLKNYKNCKQGFQQFMKLVTPGSSMIGDLNSVNGIKFI